AVVVAPEAVARVTEHWQDKRYQAARGSLAPDGRRWLEEAAQAVGAGDPGAWLARPTARQAAALNAWLETLDRAGLADRDPPRRVRVWIRDATEAAEPSIPDTFVRDWLVSTFTPDDSL